MLSIPDMAILGAAALLLFGPDQLPKVMRRAGAVMRDIQNTSHSFVREMERAADVHDPEGAPPAPPPYDPLGWQPIDDPSGLGVPSDEHAGASEPVGEKLAEPSAALEPPEPDPEPLRSPAAQHPPEGEHPTHV